MFGEKETPMWANAQSDIAHLDAVHLDAVHVGQAHFGRGCLRLALLDLAKRDKAQPGQGVQEAISRQFLVTLITVGGRSRRAGR